MSGIPRPCYADKGDQKYWSKNCIIWEFNEEKKAYGLKGICKLVTMELLIIDMKIVIYNATNY